MNIPLRTVAVTTLFAIGLAHSITAQAASWARVTNPPYAVTMPLLQLSDGTLMALSAKDYQTWFHYIPDAQGNYANGIWTQLPKMITPRSSFASQLLTSGKVWVMGGEYSGVALSLNLGYLAEIFDPVTNTWTAAAPFPNTTGCNYYGYDFSGLTTTGSSVITGIDNTAGFQTGWLLTPGVSANGSQYGIPPGTTITSVDSPTQIHLSANATATGPVAFGLTRQITGNTTAGSPTITGVASTAGLAFPTFISGPGIPPQTFVNTVTTNTISLATGWQAPVNATASANRVTLTLQINQARSSCAGDMISILLPGDIVMTGSWNNANTYLYDPAEDSWKQAAARFYGDGTDEQGFVRLADGTIIDYDTDNNGHAQRYDPIANKWSPISPADGTANGTLPVLSSFSAEFGPELLLQDGRALLVGDNGLTALYTPSTNTWAAGPSMMGTLGGQPFLFAALDAPGASLPNGHVLLAGDASRGVQTTGSTTVGSAIVAGIPSTAQLFAGWAAAGPGIPDGTTIQSVDSPTQITLSANTTATGLAVAIKFGGTSTGPTQLFDFDPVANTMTPLSHDGTNDPSYNNGPLSSSQMLALPTGQVFYCIWTDCWIYTPDGSAPAALQPAINSIESNGGGVFTLIGTQLNGQSAGSAFGDDAQNDTSFPTIRMTSLSGDVYYARTTNWSYIGVGGGPAPETVDFTLNPAITPGNYLFVVSGAGIQSNPVPVTVSFDLATITANLNGPVLKLQTLLFTALPPAVLGASPISLSATASSGLPVSFTSQTSSVCTVTANSVALLSAGTCSVTAAQAGNANYYPISATQDFAVFSPSPLNDSFTASSVDITKWNTNVSPASCGSVTELASGLQMASVAGLSCYVGLQSRFKLTGDFDVQVDFQLTSWPAQNNHTFRFVASDLPGSAGVYRNSYAGEDYQLRAGSGVVADVSATGTAGKLRLVRTGTSLSGYFWDGSKFVLLGTAPTTSDDTGITLDFAGPSDTQTVSVLLTNFVVAKGSAAGAPFINTGGVVPAYSASTTIEPGSWVSIFGSNLSQSTRTWNASSEIVGGQLPTTLDAVSVFINGKAASVYFVSPTQLSVQAPDDPTTGPVDVFVNNAAGTSNQASVTLGPAGPSFFTYGDTYAIGVIPSPSGIYGPGVYDLMGPTGRYSFATRPAKVGEVVSLYGTGFGATQPPTPAGVVVNVPYNQTVSPITVTIGGVSQAVPAFVTAAGEWQINVTVPNVPSGDQPIRAVVAGSSTPNNVFVAIQ